MKFRFFFFFFIKSGSGALLWKHKAEFHPEQDTSLSQSTPITHTFTARAHLAEPSYWFACFGEVKENGKPRGNPLEHEENMWKEAVVRVLDWHRICWTAIQSLIRRVMVIILCIVTYTMYLHIYFISCLLILLIYSSEHPIGVLIATFSLAPFHLQLIYLIVQCNSMTRGY